VTRDIIVPV
jgi:hypothetical protein